MVRTVFLVILSALLGACGILPAGDGRQSGAKQTVRGVSDTRIATTVSGQQCLAKLGGRGIGFTALPDKHYGAGCSTLNAVNLNALRGDRSEFALENIGPVTCPTADLMAGWARFGVDRAARQILGSPLRRIETMGSYSCRNVAGSGRRSAHASAEAVDVSAFILEDGRRISLLSDWSSGTKEEREFLKVVHRSACKRFGTVLGPDYNAAHRDHLHLEKGDGSFCR